LRREVAEQLFAVVNEAIRSRQREERIVCAGSGPAHFNRMPCTGDIERDAVGRIGKGEALSADVNDDWRCMGALTEAKVIPIRAVQ
jgi:hypothetical protein